MTLQSLTIFGLLLLSLIALFGGVFLLAQTWRRSRSARILDQLIEQQERAANPAEAVAPLPWRARLIAACSTWLETPLGRQLVAEDDRRLLDQCGVNDNRGKSLFFIGRLTLGALLPILLWLLTPVNGTAMLLAISFCGLAAGYMSPKWFMLKVAASRRRKVAEELPLFIDLLRLLQGVGLSIDQSLHVVQNEFFNALPILSKELEIASRQYMNGRTREQSLKRFSSVFDNQELHATARLIVQVAQYGGAVQEPLKQFGERIRESRKLYLKEKVGKLTVKMTSVMVLTLLPSLLIITGGSGFLAIIRALSKIGG